MALYSIKDLERLSGIKAHTLRIWEKRYQVLTPKRSETNIRYYLDEDLQHLLKIAFLNKNGHKISKIATYTAHDIAKKVAELTDIEDGLDGQNDALTLSVLELDRFKVERILNHKIEELGFADCLFEVIYPLLEKINLLWITGSFEQFHENFLIQIIKQKIFKSIDELSMPYNALSPTIWMFSNKGSSQDLTLLLSDYYFKHAKFNSINLGSGIKQKDISRLRTNGSPDYILIMLDTSSQQESLKPYLEEVREMFPATRILISGYMTSDISFPASITEVNDISKLRKIAENEMQERGLAL